MPLRPPPHTLAAHKNPLDDISPDLRPSTTDQEYEPTFGVAVAGEPSSRVVRVNGDLTAKGAELLSAITDQFVRDGCRSVQMDLADVTAADHEGLQSVERLRTSLDRQGVTMLVANRSIAVHDAARQ